MVPILFWDQQARVEGGQLLSYVETIIALDTPQALTQFGTLSASWLPEKGDLRIHRAELVRGDQVIDLLEGNSKFEVLRRERGLENRILDGVLTATMPVSGARLGDRVRLAYSTTFHDQAMGSNVQWQSNLPARPYPLAGGRVRVSWPKDLDVSRVKLGNAAVAEPVEEGGYVTWQADIPVDKSAELPRDAPLRYLLGQLMQVSTYPDWESVSSQMAPHYDVDGAISDGSPLADQVARIAATTEDELRRTALSLELVQDQISYLLNGLNGGNYLPQAPSFTWKERFGDCKAKSVLLLAMLRELGIKAEVVLVRSVGGDALPQLAPMPGNFDHMIVRAEIDGNTYWLDGTVSGTRLATIDVIPRFHYALPLRKEGAELMPLGERSKSTPSTRVRLKLDQSAGIRLPSLVTVEVEFLGSAGAHWRAISEQGNSDIVENAVGNAIAGIIGETSLVDRSLDYDAETGIARISGRGIQSTAWKKDATQYKFIAPAQPIKTVSFNADRTRAAWRDIPLRLNGPIYWASEFELLLPQDHSKFEVEGTTAAKDTIGGVEVGYSTEFNGKRFALSQTMRSVLDELPASEIPTARGQFTRFDRLLPVVKSPEDIRELWEYFGEDRKRLEPLLRIYAEAIAEAEPDDPTAFTNRAGFHAGVYNHAAALKDVEAALEVEASRDLYVFRGALKRELGDLGGALADLKVAENLIPDGSTYGSQVEILALLGRSDEGLALANDYVSLVDDPVAVDGLMATALGWSGLIEDGIEVLESLANRRPGDGSLLNAICWSSATWDVVTAERLSTCVEAVEKSNYAPAALDSRALAHFRLGDFKAALADLDAALLSEPGLAPSRLLRGIVLMAKGESGGKDEVSLALSMQPSLKATYKAWGLDF